MTTTQEFESYLPVYDTVPEKWEEGRQFLVEQLKKISNAVNNREIAWLLDQELLTGQRFIPGTINNQEYRSVFRKVVDFGTLPNATTKSVPHGIVIDNRYTLIDLHAAATDPIALISFVIPHATTVITNNVQIYLDAVNINITTSVNYSAYTRCFVFIDYIQEL